MVAPLSTQEYQKMVLLEQCSKPTSPCYYFNTGNALLVNILNLIWVHITPFVLITNYLQWNYFDLNQIYLELVADPVIEATARPKFEDGMWTGVLPQDYW